MRAWYKHFGAASNIHMRRNDSSFPFPLLFISDSTRDYARKKKNTRKWLKRVSRNRKICRGCREREIKILHFFFLVVAKFFLVRLHTATRYIIFLLACCITRFFFIHQNERVNHIVRLVYFRTFMIYARAFVWANNISREIDMLASQQWLSNTTSLNVGFV